MAGGIENTYHQAIRPGDVLILTRTLTNIYEKSGSTGPLIFVVYTIRVETDSGEPVMDETRTRIFR